MTVTAEGSADVDEDDVARAVEEVLAERSAR
jgi:hypothetical protein